MTESSSNKDWTIHDGSLCLKCGLDFIVPSADEIYSAVFEKKYSSLINSNDVNILIDKLSFSKYPASLHIVLSSEEDYSISLNVHAINENGITCILPWKKATDHIVIENTWYPFDPATITNILEIFKTVGVVGPGKINLRQYLSLLKNSGNQIRNEVQVEKLKQPDTNSNENPFGIKGELYPYQKKGWQWLRFMKQEKIGGILADEMGLGKTLQIIALLSSEPKEEAFPSLIVSPTTLLENWRREFKKFAPHITTIIHQGPNRTGFPSELKQSDVVIASYDTIVRDSSMFNLIEWQVLVCDEAQAIKNPITKRATSLKKVPRQTGFAVTGTPIENRLTDLWSLMDFSVPGFLGNQSDFEATYENVPDGPLLLEAVISPFILRRKVAEVAKDLPSKIIISQVLDLSDFEIDQYEHIREQIISQFASNSSLVVLIKLRLFCCHPFLIADYPNEDPTFHSNKYSRLVEIVEEIVENKSKALVFTSFNKMNDIITSDLGRRFNIYTASIDGRTEVTERQKIVDQFSDVNGAGVLVLNPVAAGTGLNITAANHVIHYNLEWNPAKEDQASARAYRRGQDRPVTIHRLYYADTVEEAINERLARKRELAGTAIVGVQGEDDDYADILNSIQKSPKNKK